MKKIFFNTLVIFLTVAVSYTYAVEITRGPYIQNAKKNSAIIRFQTDKAKKIKLYYGQNLADYKTAEDKKKKTNHRFYIKDLASYTKYYYTIWSGDKALANDDSYHFYTSKGNDAEEISFAVFGDSGDRTSGQSDIIAQIVNENLDFLLHTGDIAYDSGSFDAFDENFFAPFRKILKNTCIWTSPGNHEYKTDDGKPYLSLFSLPSNNPSNSEMYYSFNYGNAHFVSIDTTRFEKNSRFRKKVVRWLKKDLKSTGREWKFVFFHHPPYNCGYHSSSETVRKRLAPVFEKHKVDIVFSGHDHDYQRTYPLADGKNKNAGDDPDYIDPKGPIYIITGGGGSDRLDDVDNDCSFLAYGESEYHFVKVTITGNSLSFKAIDRNGKKIDGITILKN